MLKKFTLGTIAAFVLLNVALAVIGFISTRNRDLSIPDTAVEFVTSAYGGNHGALWDLSAPDYRQGRTREEFVDWSRENAPSVDRVFDWTVLSEQEDDIARAHTRVQLALSGIVSHRLMLQKIDGEWLVSAYEPYDGEWPPNEPPLADS